MESDFFTHLQPITHKIRTILRQQLTAYIHCSKINDVMKCIKQIPSAITEAQLQIDLFPPIDQMDTAVNVILNLFVQLHEIFLQCSSENCIHFLVSSSINDVMKQLFYIRQTMANAFNQIYLKEIAALVNITPEELQSQNIVDMKRIVQLLVKLKDTSRTDVKELITKRFLSLEQNGISASQVDTANIVLFDFPIKFDLIVKHDDIELLKEIGNGQSGMVKLGKFKATGEIVAVKVIKNLSFSKQEYDSFRREIYTLSVLNHPCLLRFCGYTQDSPFYIITEYMERGSLYDLLHDNPKSLSPTVRSIIAYDVACGVEYLHSRGIIHRDLKSLNILVNKNNRGKICDFGMVRMQSQSPMTGLIGTAHWMAPEVLMCSPTYDERVDIYSYGMVLWELLTGQVPYGNMTTAQIASDVLENDIRPPLPTVGPPALMDLITQCWSKNPNSRPSMSRVIALLKKSIYHFDGTDEDEFENSIGIKRKNSIPKRKRLPSIDGTNPLLLVPQIDKSIGPNKTELMIRLLKMLPNCDDAEELANAGAGRIISQTLLDPNTVHIALEKLGECTTASIFDVPVLKTLLGFSMCDNDDTRCRGLSVLIKACDLRFGFLVSTPSFVSMMLSFIKKPIPEDLFNTFMSTIWKLLSNIPSIPSDLVSLLMWGFNHVNHSAFATCLTVIMRFEDVAFTRDQWIDILRNMNDSKPFLIKYCESSEKRFSDHLFVNVLFQGKTKQEIFDIMISLASNPRFSALIAMNLPVECETAKAALIYEKLFSFPELNPIFVKHSEFYSVSAYYIVNARVEPIFLIFKSCDIVVDKIQNTPFCRILASVLEKCVDADVGVQLMAICFTILKSTPSPELISCLPIFMKGLSSDQYSLRMPSFLCASKISFYQREGIDIGQLMMAAAYYVNIDSRIMREVAANVINANIMSPHVNLNDVIKVFVEQFKEADQYTKIVVDAFGRACQSSKAEIDPVLMQNLSKVYSIVHA